MLGRQARQMTTHERATTTMDLGQDIHTKTSRRRADHTTARRETVTSYIPSWLDFVASSIHGMSRPGEREVLV